jgi:hypothetical protein
VKQTITFEINPIEDGQDEIKRIAHYEDFSRACWEVDQYCRNQIKHGDVSEETDKHLDHIRDLLREHIPGDFL